MGEVIDYDDHARYHPTHTDRAALEQTVAILLSTEPEKRASIKRKCTILHF